MTLADNPNRAAKRSQVLERGVDDLISDLIDLEKGTEIIYAVDFTIIPVFADPDTEWATMTLIPGTRYNAEQEKELTLRSSLLTERLLFGRFGDILLLPPHAYELDNKVHGVLSQYLNNVSAVLETKQALSQTQKYYERIEYYRQRLSIPNVSPEEVGVAFDFVKCNLADFTPLLGIKETRARLRLIALLKRGHVHALKNFPWQSYGVDAHTTRQLQTLRPEPRGVQQWYTRFHQDSEPTKNKQDTRPLQGIRVRDSQALDLVAQINRTLASSSRTRDIRLQFVSQKPAMLGVATSEPDVRVPVRHPRLLAGLLDPWRAGVDRERRANRFAGVRAGLQLFKDSVVDWRLAAVSKGGAETELGQRCAESWLDFEAGLSVYRESVGASPTGDRGGDDVVREVPKGDEAVAEAREKILMLLTALVRSTHLGDAFQASSVQGIARADLGDAARTVERSMTSFEGRRLQGFYEDQILIRSVDTPLPYIVAFFSKEASRWQVEKEFNVELRNFLVNLLDTGSALSDDAIYEGLLAAAFITASQGQFGSAINLCRRALSLAPENMPKVESNVLLSICSRALAYRERHEDKAVELFRDGVAHAFAARDEQSHQRLRRLAAARGFPATPRLDLGEAMLARQVQTFPPVRAMVERLSTQEDGLRNFASDLLRVDVHLNSCEDIVRTMAGRPEYLYFAARARQTQLSFALNGLTPSDTDVYRTWTRELLDMVMFLLTLDGWNWHDLPVGLQITYLLIFVRERNLDIDVDEELRQRAMGTIHSYRERRKIRPSLADDWVNEIARKLRIEDAPPP